MASLLSKAHFKLYLSERVFILGPSHHHYLAGCALSSCDTYETPLGDLKLDAATISELHATGLFERMSQSVDEAEHSIEMHLPYLHKVLTRTLSDYTSHLPPIVPILVGNTDTSAEQRYGALLAPYLASPANAFIVSSDFAHWGTRFRYTYYEPRTGAAGVSLKAGMPGRQDAPIHDSIARVDMETIAAVESGACDAFAQVLRRTGNTVCGRHPIGVVMAGLETVRASTGGDYDDGKKGRFRFVRYERSSDVVSVRDSSVSYASAFAVM